MARVILAEIADADAADIIADLGDKAGESVADRYSKYFEDVYLRLEQFPAIGAPRSRLGKYTRICVVIPYVIIYEYSKSDDLVTVLRIIDGRRKMTRRLLRR